MGFEIADMRGLGADFSGEMVVYLEAGPNPITAEAWNTYVPDAGWIENTPRQPQFDQLIVLGSPYVPAGQFTSHTDSQGYTWQSVAAVQNRAYPFDAADYASYDPPLTTSAQAGYALTTPLPGTIQYNSNDKNHENIYNARDADGNPKLQYYVTDPWGNVYILKSVNAANDTPEEVAAAVDSAVLPDGWVKSTGYLAQDTSYLPVYSGDLAHANEFRDSADSAWMQIEWSGSGVTLPAMVGDGMPIWGSEAAGLLLGTAAADEMRGGGGNDTVYGATGNDTVWGDAGDDLVVGGSSGVDSDTSGSDVIYGNQGADTTSGAAGADTLYGGQDADIVYGNAGDDVLHGNRGNDRLFGGQGADTLYGGEGNDLLEGGQGADRYVLGSGSGADTVTGFSSAQGDVIAVAANVNGSGIATADDLLALLFVDNLGNAMIRLGGGHTVVLAGVPPSSVTAADLLVF